MALRIWETDPESAPKPRKSFADDLVGRFRSGYVSGKRPVALDHWRVTTGDPEVADAVADLLDGSQPEEWDATGEDNLETYTEADSVRIIIDSPKALRSEMVLWGRSGPIRRCDGVQQHGEGDEGKPCECPASYQDRKEAAKNGKGCQPSVTLFFSLDAQPELGKFKFQSGSWSLVRDLAEVEAKLAEIDGPALAMLALEKVEFTAKDTGAQRSFTKPVINVLGPAPEDDGKPPF